MESPEQNNPFPEMTGASGEVITFMVIELHVVTPQESTALTKYVVVSVG